MATAPISWGICEVPGWGVQLPVDRVLSEMASLGFTSTELGSDGYLPSNPAELRSVLAPHNLDMLAAFVPVIVHQPHEADETLRRCEDMAQRLAAMGGTYFNSSPVTTWDWAPREVLTDAQWDHTMEMFGRIQDITDAHGLKQVLHSHVGTIVETREEVVRVIEGCDVSFVLDTAHLAVGGMDPLDFVQRWPDRVGLVHIKDADMSISDRLNAGELTLMEAVQADIFPTVGKGDLPIDRVITTLEAAGYQDWYVLEQDVAITGDMPEPGEGPVVAVQESLNYLRELEGLSHA